MRMPPDGGRARGLTRTKKENQPGEVKPAMTEITKSTGSTRACGANFWNCAMTINILSSIPGSRGGCHRDRSKLKFPSRTRSPGRIGRPIRTLVMSIPMLTLVKPILEDGLRQIFGHIPRRGMDGEIHPRHVNNIRPSIGGLLP